MIQLRADPKPFYEGMRKAAKALNRIEKIQRKQASIEGLTLDGWRRKQWDMRWHVSP